MIEFKSLKMKEYRQYAKDLDILLKAKPEGMVAQVDSNIELGKLMGRYIKTWDFADEETGELLELPSKNPEILEELNNKQLQELITGFHASQKNEVPNSKGDNS